MADFLLHSLDTDDLYREFRFVFDQLYNPLCGYAFRLVKDRDACEDIVQDVFVRIWEKRKDLIVSENIRFYLFTSVRNNCLTHLGRGQRLPVYSLSYRDMEEEGTGDWNAAVEKAAGESTDYRALLEKGIELLPPKCKEVFLLNRMGQLSNREIGETFGISVKTVENQLWKAMKMLRAFAKGTPKSLSIKSKKT